MSIDWRRSLFRKAHSWLLGRRWFGYLKTVTVIQFMVGWFIMCVSLSHTVSRCGACGPVAAAGSAWMIPQWRKTEVAHVTRRSPTRASAVPRLLLHLNPHARHAEVDLTAPSGR